MITIAITGSIGMGKSTVAAMFARAGIPVFDADAEVRAMQAPGGRLVEPIAKRFPAAMRGGRLDRDALARLVLSDPTKLAELEALVHPAVAEARNDFVEANRDRAALAFEIPLLFETGGETAFDKVVVVSALPEVQQARALKRPGMTFERLEAILARQLSDAEKRARADFVIDNNGDLAATEDQVRAILACLGLAADS